MLESRPSLLSHSLPSPSLLSPSLHMPYAPFEDDTTRIMSNLGNYYVVPRKPVPRRTDSSLQVARSHSTLWRPWSPRLGSTAEYERSLHKFPWLSDEPDDGNFYEDLEGGYAPAPRLSSRFHEHLGRRPDMVQDGVDPHNPPTIPEDQDQPPDSHDDDLVSDPLCPLCF